MDRSLVYPGSIPLDSDILGIQRNTMVALGYLAQATLGTGTLVDGLACTPTSPASLRVNVSSGSIIALSTVDATAYGSLPADTTDALVKMGINFAATPFTLTAPSVSGQSQNYLIEASFQEQDGSPVVLPYFNASNPAQAFSGPNNSGTPQNTTRRQTVGLQIKAGAPANAGAQVTPTVDAGWVGLYLITVNFGMTQITSAQISKYPSTSFIGTKIPGFRQRLLGDLVLYVAATGNDGNSGLVAWSPLATLQAAWNSIQRNYDLNGFNAVINLAAGTYTQGLLAQGTVPGQGQGNTISLIGNNAAATTVIISTTSAHAVQATNGAALSISGLTLQAGGTGPASNPPSCVVAGNGASISVTNVQFNSATGFHVWSTQNSTISLSTNYVIAGGGQAHMAASGNGVVTGNSVSVIVTGTPAFSVAFIEGSLLGLIQPLAFVFTGAATGARYTVFGNGVINTGGGGANYFPGNAVGASATGGQYL